MESLKAVETRQHAIASTVDEAAHPPGRARNGRRRHQAGVPPRVGTPLPVLGYVEHFGSGGFTPGFNPVYRGPAQEGGHGSVANEPLGRLEANFVADRPRGLRRIPELSSERAPPPGNRHLAGARALLAKETKERLVAEIHWRQMCGRAPR